jgi:acetyl-CoA carboxylase biotin carboxylase subunit
MIKKILIANRGEIAVRIIRTCKEMGIETVAVYSTADKNSLHVSMANEAVCIGPAKSADSYLNMNAIIQAACNTGCDAIHPGFGFLSENSEFANLVEECGLIFVGPSHQLLDLLGNKSNARKLMREAGIPLIPGSKESVESIEQGLKIADEIGYPIIIKASNGGGGRGMRVVHHEDEFVEMFNQAKSEAKACFSDDDVYIEKYIENPKHIEVQVAGDKFGNVIHLFERDCSFQRRHQKMIEEAPCHYLKEETRQQLFDTAIKICQTVHYYSLGTIEFLVDKYGNYYFMEMNTRIQVEHPITEMICDVDLVKLQIRIANNQKINIKQSDIKCQGYALECRINAEDINKNFAPTPGKIQFLHLPGGKGIRIDSAMFVGGEVSPYYDSMILKLITFSSTRLECIRKMRSALSELIVDGIETNEKFHYYVMHSKEFIEGSYDTGFCESFIKELKTNGSIV